MKCKNKKILLADPDVNVVKKLNSSLKNLGVKFFNAKDGPRALELAVSTKVDLIIMEISLPFLNAIRIAQILKSNPNTKDIPIIFMTSGEINSAYLPFLENAVIKKPFKINDVVARIEASLLKVEKSIEVKGESKEVQGNLAQMPIVDILQIFNMNKKEGVLVLRRETEAQEGMIFLTEGEIINAVIGAVKGEKALYRLLGWQDGTFEYIPKNFNPEVSIEKPTDALLMEGMRQLDELRRIEEEFPSMDAHLYMKIEPRKFPSELRPVTKEVLALLEFYKKVSDVVNNCAYPDFEVMITIHTLVSKGILECRQKEIKKGKQALPILTSEEAFAIKEGLKTPYRETYEMDTVKIPLMASSFEEIKTITNVLTKIDGFVMEKGFFLGEGKSAPFGPVGKIKVSDNITILFHAFPYDDAYLPLWPPFMGDSIGIILLRKNDKENNIKTALKRLRRIMDSKPVIINFDTDDNEADDDDIFQINMKDVKKEEPGEVFRKILGSFLKLKEAQ